MVLQRALREFPDFDLVSQYEAALALYHLRIGVKVLQKSELSVMARYVLRAIALGQTTPHMLAHLLGLSEADIAMAGDELLRTKLISQGPVTLDGVRGLGVTTEGLDHVRSDKQVFVPRRRTLHVHFDSLTGELRPRERYVASYEAVRKDGVFVIHGNTARPTLGSLDLSRLKAVVAEDDSSPDDFDILGIVNLDEPYVEYVRGIQVFVLQHRETQARRLAAFRGFEYLAMESEMLHRLEQEGLDVVPAELDENSASSSLPSVLQNAIPPQTVKAIKEIEDRSLEEVEIQQRIVQTEAVRSSTADDTERRIMGEELRRLQEELRQKTQETLALRAQVKDASGNALEILSTVDHRPLLEQAFKDAKDEIIIISPWMNRRAVDDDLIDLLASALKRGVTIRIGYGYAFENNAREAERNRNNARNVIEGIRIRTNYRQGPKLNFVDLGGTHEKLLNCDRAFAVTTSFNWLSYRGEQDAEFRRETGTLIRGLSQVEKLAQYALDALVQGRDRANGQLMRP